MRYCTWKLELVSNILWVIVGIAHIHCFVCITHTDFQKYWICCTTMLYLAFSSVYIWIKKVVEVLAFQRDMQRYRWYHPLLSGLPWNAISNLDTLHIGRNQVASKKIRFFWYPLPSIVNILNFIQEWIKRFITWHLPDIAFIIFAAAKMIPVAFCYFSFLTLHRMNDARYLKQIRFFVVALQKRRIEHNTVLTLLLNNFACNMISLQLTPPFRKKFHSKCIVHCQFQNCAS